MTEKAGKRRSKKKRKECGLLRRKSEKKAG